MPHKTCTGCIWVHQFTPRPDERARGQLLGCQYPGWEGYTQAEHPACGGVFYRAQPGAQGEANRLAGLAGAGGTPPDQVRGKL